PIFVGGSPRAKDAVPRGATPGANGLSDRACPARPGNAQDGNYREGSLGIWRLTRVRVSSRDCMHPAYQYSYPGTNIGADMGGVSSQEDAAHLISLRLPAVDTVVHPPDGITQHATRGPGIEYRLEVLQGWLSQRRMISLGWANIGSEGSASSRQRETGEHTLGSEKKGVLIPRQLPVNLDICRHEIGGIIVTRERDTECMANQTVGAVAGDEIGDAGRFLSAIGRLKRCAHPVFVLLERNKFNTPFHVCAETRQIAGHYTLRLALWQLQKKGKG